MARKITVTLPHGEPPVLVETAAEDKAVSVFPDVGH